MEQNGNEEEEIVPKSGSFSPTILRKRPLPPINSLPSQNANHCRKKTRDLPNISNCHSCGLRFPDKGKNESLQPLHSQWRVVFLCSGCLKLVQYAKICSYCFSSLAESENGVFIDCLRCSCRVHLTCIPKQRGYATPLDLDPCSFKCVDCCSLPAYFSVIKHVDGGVGGGDGKEAVASRVAKSAVIINKTDVGERAKEKTIAANHASGLGISALAVVKYDDGVDDPQLALGLHKSMNGSQRILRNHCPRNTNSIAENVGCSSNKPLSNAYSLEKHERSMPVNAVHLQGDDDINGPALSSSQGLDVLFHGTGEDSTAAQENETPCGILPDHRYQKKYYCRQKLDTSPDHRYQIKYNCRKNLELRKTFNNNKSVSPHMNMNCSNTSKTFSDASEESGGPARNLCDTATQG